MPIRGTERSSQRKSRGRKEKEKALGGSEAEKADSYAILLAASAITVREYFSGARAVN